MRHAIIVAFSAATCLVGPKLDAQRSPGDGFTGVREPARLLDQVARPVETGTAVGVRGTAPVVPRHFLLVIPAFAHGADVSVYGATVGYINKQAPVPFQIRLTDRLLDIGATTKNRVAIDGKLSLLSNPSFLRMSLAAGYQDTKDVSTRQSYALATDATVWEFGASKENAISIGATAAYVRNDPDGAPKGDTGPTFAPGLIAAFGDAIEFTADYQAKSHVDGEDDFSIGVARTFPVPLGKPTVILVAGKHKSLAINVVFLFP